jgi:hypothetical protein
VGFSQDRAEFGTRANPSAASQDQREISLSDTTVELEITELHSRPAQIFSALDNFQSWHTHSQSHELVYVLTTHLQRKIIVTNDLYGILWRVLVKLLTPASLQFFLNFSSLGDELVFLVVEPALPTLRRRIQF